MAAYSTPRIFSFVAEEDLSSSQYCFVKWGTANKQVALCGANEAPCGILQNAPAINSTAEVALPGGGAKLKVNEAVAKGKRLTSTSTGLGEVVDAAGEEVGAIAYEAATAQNDVIGVEVVAAYKAQGSDA